MQMIMQVRRVGSLKSNLILLICSVLPIFFIGQTHGIYSELRERNVEGNSRGVIWSESFSNGMSSGWIAEEIGDVANWEYRGISTNPNINTGNRGACALFGTDGRIESPTWQDGFVIFDSFWIPHVSSGLFGEPWEALVPRMTGMS